MSAKKEKESRTTAGRRLVEIVKRHPGERGLIHSVSFERAGWIADVLRSAGLGSRVVTYARGSEREEALERHRQTPEGVLIGPSIGRGTDCKYDLARFNIMAKIPYPYLGDEQVSARFHSPGGSLWYALETVGMIEQIFGRAMRAEDDWMQGYITDSGWSQFYSKHRHLFKAAFREAIRTDDQDVLVRAGIRIIQSDKPPPDPDSAPDFTSVDPWEDFPDPWERERVGSVIPGRKR
jgi:Rad3-related DNA helicase